MKNCVVLLSGGLDSATTLAIARDSGFTCYALSIHYEQRHLSELKFAERIGREFKVKEHKIIKINLDEIGGSALTDTNIEVPDKPTNGIPSTYVPARNTIFLSLALAYAEVLPAQDIFIGVNAVDYSGYPDCRPEYVRAFENMANLATKQALAENKIKINTPLIDLSKAQIIKTGIKLGVDYSMTVSCYNADINGAACGVCDSCRIRAKGFADAGVDDPSVFFT